MEILTLFELNSLVHDVIEDALPDNYWVQAELSEVRLGTKGHCFIELIEKNEHNNTPIAKARGVIMANVYPLLKMNFEGTTGQSFCAGLKVLLEVRLSFSEMYGYSLIVTDIDPTYTLGDMARKRKDILDRLERDGVLHLNQELPLPSLMQRIAVVSSPTAAGYGDFCHQLDSNSRGLHFIHRLFPATMQGEQVEKTIIEALDQIAMQSDEWDAVVIIRGGGAVSDLSGFESYNLANNCAQFPLPLFTGIGHERDTTVLDFVANQPLKTPTAVADFLIGHLSDTADHLDHLDERLTHAVLTHVEEQQKHLEDIQRSLQQFSSHFASSRIQVLDHYLQQITTGMLHHLQTQRLKLSQSDKLLEQAALHCMDRQHNHLAMIEKSISLSDPQRILQMGYSITLHQGKAVRDAARLQSGEELKTKVAHGEITSIVK